MTRTLPANGMMNHAVVGLCSMIVAVLVGIAGGVLSLLLRWPGLEQAGPAIGLAAHAHVPLLVLFAAIPASLGGLAVASVPAQVGADRSAFPVLHTAALGATILSLLLLVGAACGLGRACIVASATVLAVSAVLNAAGLVTTILITRRLAYSALPCFAWTSLIAAVFSLCAAPIMAAVYSVHLWRGDAALAVLPDLLAPALCVVLVLMLGLVTDILGDASDAPGPTPRAIPVLLGAAMLALLMTWAYGQENRIILHPGEPALQGLLLVPTVPVVLLWCSMVVRAPGTLRRGGLPVLFAAGFVLTLVVGLVTGLLGVAGHEAISLSIVFGVLAGFFRMTHRENSAPIAAWSPRAQFWLLLGGCLSLVLPMPPLPRAIGAAMASLSVALFVLHLVAALIRSWSGDLHHATVSGRTMAAGARAA